MHIYAEVKLCRRQWNLTNTNVWIFCSIHSIIKWKYMRVWSQPQTNIKAKFKTLGDSSRILLRFAVMSSTYILSFWPLGFLCHCIMQPGTLGWGLELNSMIVIRSETGGQKHSCNNIFQWRNWAGVGTSSKIHAQWVLLNLNHVLLALYDCVQYFSYFELPIIILVFSFSQLINRKPN